MIALAVALALAASQPRPADGPPDLVDKAYAAAEQKRYCDAIPLFLSLHERAPQAKHLYRAAEVAYAAGDRRLALDLYRSVIDSYPTFEKRKTVDARIKELNDVVKRDGPGTTCPEPAKVCGDWIVRPGEQCDDGNLTDGDGCDSNCTLTSCGNGIVTPTEACDDGNAADGDGCDGNCTLSACGNGVVAGTEECDDGNHVDGDGCDHDCTDTRCGNGVRTAGEDCDDGNTQSGDGCDRNCKVTSCGNGALDPNEECDDGNKVDGDGCDRGCVATRCGNGVLTAGEECDDGNTKDGDACDRNCTKTRCGNGVQTAGEACDDGNTKDGDACSSDCQTITGGHDRVLAGGLTFGGGVLMVAGTVVGLAGTSPLVDHMQIAGKIADAEKHAQQDPRGSLDTARALQEDDAFANDRWQKSGLPLVVTGALTLLVGGVGGAAGWFLWNGADADPKADPANEERVP